jgi:hypothetical protein
LARNAAYGLAVALLLAVACAWPGDAPFINDEPRLIATALDANAAGRLATAGMLGHLGIRYGPVPAWIYQIALVSTTDLVAVVLIKSLLTAAALVAVLLWIGRAAGLWRLPVLTVLVSPFLWFYGRLLWDCCYLIPFSAAVVAAYVAFVRRPCSLWMGTIVVLGLAMFETHLMSLFLLLPLGAVMLGVGWRWLRPSWWKVALLLVAAGLLVFPYLRQIFDAAGELPLGTRGAGARWASASTSAGFLTFVGFADYFIPEFLGHPPLLRPEWVHLAIGLSSVGILLAAAGLAEAVVDLVRGLRRRSSGLGPSGSLGLDTRTALDVLGLATLAFTFLFYGLVDLLPLALGPHYLSAVWFAAFYFFWRFVSDHGARPWVRVAFWSHFAVMAGLLVLLAVFIHVHGGNRGIHYGPTLSNQIAVARELNRYGADGHVVLRSDDQSRFPHALAVLRRLYPVQAENATRTALLAVDYRKPDDPTSGFIEVEVAGFLRKRLEPTQP